MKRTTLGGTAVVALVMAMLLTGCLGGGGGGDTWTNVTSLSQINGTWKTTNTHTQTFTEDPDTGDPVPNGLTITSITEGISTFNAKAGTASGTAVHTVKFTQSTGETTNLNYAWTAFKDNFEDQFPTATFDDATYTATATTSTETVSITLADLGSVQINQTKKKMKIADSEFTKQ